MNQENKLLHTAGLIIRNPLASAGIIHHIDYGKSVKYFEDNPLWLKARIKYVLVTLLVIVSAVGPILGGFSLLFWLDTFTRVSELSVMMMGIVMAQATYLFVLMSHMLYYDLPSTKKVLTKWKTVYEQN